MKNCYNYDDINCPKNMFLGDKIINKTEFHSLFLGCWGVYCKKGSHQAYKYKNKEEKFEIAYKTYGEGYVVSDMINYSQKNNLDAVILAGDNVYGDEPDDKLKEKILKFGDNSLLYNIDKQLSTGFENCMQEVIASDFLMGIGNHDIENCRILNTQLNYEKWTMPALSYNVVYKMRGFNINLIFIDTNMYESNVWCQGMYPKDAKEKQDKWLELVLNTKHDFPVWNIVIGHIPFKCNSHKNKNPRYESQLYNVIEKNKNKIDLYMCADEHNQQYILINDMPPQVISGSGGAVLDMNVFINELSNETKLVRPVFGFVSLVVSASEIQLTFRTAQTQPSLNDEIRQPVTFTIQHRRSHQNNNICRLM